MIISSSVRVTSILCLLLSCLIHVKTLHGGDNQRISSSDYNFVVFIGDEFVTAHSSIRGSMNGFYTQCLGVLITEKHVIALNECVEKSLIGDSIPIRAGSYGYTKCKKFNGILLASYNDWAKHKELSPLESHQNVALITLPDKFRDLKINPVFVPKKNEEFYGTKVTVIGLPSQKANQGDRLWSATFKLMSKSLCEEKMPHELKRDAAEKLLCSTADAEMTHRDYSGPILYDQDTLVGINVGYLFYETFEMNNHLRFNYLRNFIESNIVGAQLRLKPETRRCKGGSG